MRAAALLATLLAAMLMAPPSAAISVWTQPLCDGCCVYTTAVGQPLSIVLHAARVNGSVSPVSIFPAEDPGIPIGASLQSQVANSSFALSVLSFTPLPLHQNLSLTLFVLSTHDAAASSVCLVVRVRAPAPYYAAGSLSSISSFSAAVNCPVSVTVTVEDPFYACNVRISRLQTISPTGALASSIPNHALETLVTANRSSLTLKFVPAFGSESSNFTACFIGGDAIGMRQLAEVCATWTVSKCE
jgi:hypothetical protein